MDPRLDRFENAWDRGEDLEKILKSWPEIATLAYAMRARKWGLVREEANRVLQAEVDSVTKAFALNWAIASTEIEFDLEKRTEWLNRWSQIPDWSSHPYCRFIRAYQQSLTSFFEGSLREAEARFKTSYEIALQFDYQRGLLRCLFHLGLIQKEQDQVDAAIEYFHHALAIAKERSDHCYVGRIEAQLARFQNVQSEEVAPDYEWIRTKIEETLIAGDFEKARRDLLESEVKRRRAGMRRKRESLYVYLPLIALGRKKITRRKARSRIGRFTDPILKIRLYELKGRVFGWESGEKLELESLKDLQGIARVVTRAEICGISMDDILDQDIKRLVVLLMESDEGVSKEEICKTIWNLDYDPVVHDGKIYKLFHKSRAYFKRHDLFVNTYGAYQLNPKFRPKKALAVARVS
jgi:tetratricopeptide (TPR) repeat protein